MFCVRSRIKNTGNVVQSVLKLSLVANKLIDVIVDDDGIAVMTLKRSPVNSLNLDLLECMNNSLDNVANAKCKGMILTSAMPTTFIAGLDILELYKPDLKRAESMWKVVHELWLKLYGAGYVTTAAINGHAPGGGCLLALACEYRVMVQGKFKIGLNEAAVGVIAQPWTMDNMLRTVSTRQAELALTTAKLFTADEALKVRLIDAIARDKQDAIDKCKEFIKQFDDISSTLRAITKQKMREGPIRKLQENRQKDIDSFLDLLQNPEVQANLEVYINQLRLKSKIRNEQNTDE